MAAIDVDATGAVVEVVLVEVGAVVEVLVELVLVVLEVLVVDEVVEVVLDVVEVDGSVSCAATGPELNISTPAAIQAADAV